MRERALKTALKQRRRPLIRRCFLAVISAVFLAASKKYQLHQGIAGHAADQPEFWAP
jgi:hypothetical protein